MAAKKGSLSISSENIFPIIKKWVYSDHDIFVRELVSNGCDAITKLKKLDMILWMNVCIIIMEIMLIIDGEQYRPIYSDICYFCVDFQAEEKQALGNLVKCLAEYIKLNYV